jgi:hypothetical protein
VGMSFSRPGDEGLGSVSFAPVPVIAGQMQLSLTADAAPRSKGRDLIPATKDVSCAFGALGVRTRPHGVIDWCVGSVGRGKRVDGLLRADTKLRSSKYLNNLIEDRRT